jgi:hypothetical protein
LLSATKSQQARLRSVFGIQMQNVVIVPCDVDTAGHSHDVRSAIRLALLARGLVLRRIPLVKYSTALGV